MRTIKPTVKICATKKYCEMHGKDNGCALMLPTDFYASSTGLFDCLLFRDEDDDFVSLESDSRGTLRCQQCLDSEVGG